MKRHTKLGLSIAFLISVSSSALGDCDCRGVTNGETTHWGGNRRIEMEYKIDLKVMRGGVESGQKPIQGVLMEVFANTESSLPDPSNGNQENLSRSRVAACRTGADGKFCFRHLASGKYQLRSSIGSGWDVTFVNCVVNTKTGKNEQIDVPMHVGD
jgi:hypothetical protein